MNLKLLALLALTLNLEAFASSVVVCRNSEGSITSSEHLDYYEGRVNRNIPHYFDSQLTHEEYFEKLRDKISFLYDAYYKDEFLKQSKKLSEAITAFRRTGKTDFKGFVFTSENLTNYAEDTLVMPPKGCNIENALAILRPVMPGDPEFLIQKEVAKNLSEDGVRGLITHAILSRFLEKGYDVRYVHQKITAISIEKLNYRYFYETFKTQLKSIGEYKTDLMEILPTGELFYDHAYVLNDDGKVNREKTFLHGEFKTKWEFYADGKTWHVPTVMPKGSIVSIKFEDGTVVETKITNELRRHTENLNLKHGLIDVNLFIPAQIVKPAFGIFQQSLDDVDFSFDNRSVFADVKVGLKRVNLTKTLEVTLDENDRWIVKKLN